MIKTIIFDLDNTLIDFWRMKQLSLKAAVKAMIKVGMTIPEEQALKEIYKIYDEVGYEERFIFQKFFEKHGKIDYRIIAHGVVAYKEEWRKHHFAYPDVESTLEKLQKKGVKMGLITDAPRMKAYQRLVKMKIDHYFDFVITFDDTNVRKPDPKPFMMALEMSRVKPGEILMIGDSIEGDIKGAKNAGMKTALAKYGRASYGSVARENTDTKADYELDSVADVLRIF